MLSRLPIVFAMALCLLPAPAIADQAIKGWSHGVRAVNNIKKKEERNVILCRTQSSSSKAFEYK